MFTHEVVEGRHIHYGSLYGKGERFTDKHDLTLTYPGKFRIVDANAAPNTPAKNGQAAPEKDEDEETTPVTKTLAADDAGKDVTDKFAVAGEQDYKVYRGERGYWVYNGDDLTKPVNAEPVQKAAVNGVIDADLKKQQ